MIQSALALAPRIINYKSSRLFGTKPPLPINLTISVTNQCNSKCKTCAIWRQYSDHQQLRATEFKAEEFKKAFEKFEGKIFWATLSGGEPFMRRDIVEIFAFLCENCHPAVVNIPSNGLLSSVIESNVRKMLEKNYDTNLTLNLSLDGVGEKHEKIRGIPGNFEKVLDTYERVRRLKEEFPRFQIGIHTVISKHNIADAVDVYEFAKGLAPDSYITEVAEHRTELFNIEDDITPDAKTYARFANALSKSIRTDYLNSKKNVSKLTQSFRLEYYQFAAQMLKENRQVIPCYAGYASCQITPFGDVWPCCILGYAQPMGNLRETQYDFKKIWYSQRANEIRKHIKDRNCACPLANAYYTNALCNFSSLIGVSKNLITN
ncbi:MAG: radical SAM protein [Candidatus Bathyarchaeota archaeon]|nr:radical SAM protein [Candidatus Bathyarchaeota archaeon]